MPPPPVSPEIKSDVDQVLEAIIYLYTESRRLTKELARRADLTGPQLTVVKMLEQIGDHYGLEVEQENEGGLRMPAWMRRARTKVKE